MEFCFENCRSGVCVHFVFKHYNLQKHKLHGSPLVANSLLSHEMLWTRIVNKIGETPGSPKEGIHKIEEHSDKKNYTVFHAFLLAIEHPLFASWIIAFNLRCRTCTDEKHAASLNFVPF